MMRRKIQCFEFEILKRKDRQWVAKVTVPKIVRRRNVRYPSGEAIKFTLRRSLLEYLEYAYGRKLEKVS